MTRASTSWPARRRVAVLALLLLLSGCVLSPAPAIGIKTAVSEPPCNTSVPRRPAYAGDRLTGDEDLWTIGTTLWAERKQRQAHELDLTTRLEGCVAPANREGTDMQRK